MTKKYFIPISDSEKRLHPRNFPAGTKFYLTIDSWRNFIKACEHDDEVIKVWLETEYNAKLINDVVVFEDEKDKIMWLLRWG